MRFAAELEHESILPSTTFPVKTHPLVRSVHLWERPTVRAPRGGGVVMGTLRFQVAACSCAATSRCFPATASSATTKHLAAGTGSPSDPAPDWHELSSSHPRVHRDVLRLAAAPVMHGNLTATGPARTLRTWSAGARRARWAGSLFRR